ncbi:YfcC family protein [Bhargavaea cecembensis]|uniref:YfcC family protein n=1 Tax=Bhargavaea cecembensis TaxID=394098 RepID=UPI00058ED1CA|nr:YfcC family protein [Bhargavaea cecembensis]
MEKKQKFKMPSTYTIILCIIIGIALLSWVIPGGTYEYESNNGTDRPIPDTYHTVESHPQGFGGVIMAPINGFMESVDIILYTLVIGGFLAVVMKTGAIDAGIGHAIRKLKGREKLLIPALMLMFSLAGASFGIEEETLPFFLVLIPVLLAAGYDTLTGIAVIKLGAALGVMASFANPFAVAIASRFAGISMGDGIVIRIVLLLIYIPAGILFTMRYAEKVKKDPTQSLVYAQKEENEKFFLKDVNLDNLLDFTKKRKAVLAIFILAFVVMMWGVLPWGELGISFIPTMNWWFGELSAVFLVASLLVGFVARFKEEEFIDTFIDGAKGLLGVAIIIGVARGVAVVMNDAMITDTVLHAGESVLSNTSSSVFAAASYIIYLVLSFFIPSSSALATLSMGIMAPLADFAGVGREIVVIAYQSANAMLSLISPTVAILMGVLVMTKTSYLTWIKFIWKFALFIGLVTIVVLVGTTLIMN